MAKSSVVVFACQRMHSHIYLLHACVNTLREAQADFRTTDSSRWAEARSRI